METQQESYKRSGKGILYHLFSVMSTHLWKILWVCWNCEGILAVFEKFKVALLQVKIKFCNQTYERREITLLVVNIIPNVRESLLRVL